MKGKMRFFGLFTIMALVAAVIMTTAVGWAQKAAKPPRPPAPPADPAIAYVVNGSQGKRITGNLMVMNADGSNQRAVLAESGANYGCPEWSPDGKQLAFIKSTGSGTGIYVINIDGSGLSEVFDSGGGEFEGPATWSPVPLADGRHKLAFCYSLRRPDGTYEIDHDAFIVNLDGTGLTRLTDTPGLWESPISWSPGADRVTFPACCDPQTGDGGFGVHSLVYSGGVFSLVMHSICYEFGWGIWANTQDRLISGKNGLNDLWIYDMVDPDASYPLTFTGLANYEHDASWSPDDSKILFVQGPSGQLYIVNTSDGSGVTPICPGVDFTWRSPRWRRNP